MYINMSLLLQVVQACAYFHSPNHEAHNVFFLSTKYRNIVNWGSVSVRFNCSSGTENAAFFNIVGKDCAK